MRRLILSGAITLAMVLLNLFIPQAPTPIPIAEAQSSCTHHASTQAQIDQFIASAQPGNVLCIADGTYYTLVIPTSFAGTASQPITIRAVNDGKVLFNGGNARAVDLRGSYGILEGVNARGGDNGAIQLRGDHWIARRVVAWNASMSDDHDSEVIGIAGTNNVIEDCAAFGVSRGTLRAGAGAQNQTNNVVRRCWVRFEERSVGGSPTLPAELGYGQDAVTFENVLATRDRVPGTYLTGPEAAIIVHQTENSYVMGSIAYSTASGIYDAGQIFTVWGDLDRPTRNVTLKDIV